MIFLAWYTLVFIALTIAINIGADGGKSRGLRLASVICSLPMLIFALLYVL